MSVADYKKRFPREIPITPDGSPIEFTIKRDGIFSVVGFLNKLDLTVTDAQRDKMGFVEKMLAALEVKGRGPLDECLYDIVLDPPLHLEQEELGPDDLVPGDITIEHGLEIIGAIATEGGDAAEDAATFPGDGAGDGARADMQDPSPVSE